MGIKNHIDNKGFWSDGFPGSNSPLIISGSVTQKNGTTSYYSPTINYSTQTIVLSTTLPSDSFLFIDASAGNVNLTLPAIVENGYRLTIKKIDQTGNYITINGSTNSEKIDEEVTKQILSAFSSLRLITNNGKWWIF